MEVEIIFVRDILLLSLTVGLQKRTRLCGNIYKEVADSTAELDYAFTLFILRLA